MPTPTPEQEAILLEAKTKDNLLITALAGAAKTSTLVMLAPRLPMVPTLSVQFNKRIAEEIAKRLPGHITTKTMNAIGHGAWQKRIARRLIVEQDKIYSLTEDRAKLFAGEEKKLYSEAFSSIMRTCRAAKAYGYIPAEFTSLGKPFADWDEVIANIANQLDAEPDGWFQSQVDEILKQSISLAFEGKIDYDDQIYMSVCFSGEFPTFAIILVDEAQDLSSLNHEILRRMMSATSRLIAVGDPNQAIYGFRGAHDNSMSLLKDEFQMKELTLSVSFRCPIQVVKRARWRAPHMAYPDWAAEGLVSRLPEWGTSDIEDHSAVICRNNAPLFSIALRFIRAGRGIKLVGNDIGANLIKILKKFGDDRTSREDLLLLIKSWESDAIEKAVMEQRQAAIRDRADCLRVFAEQSSTLGEAIAFAEHLFSAAGPVLFMSGHKSKGLEFDTVFHLDPFLIPSKGAKIAADNGDDSRLQQELNIRYVIETRSKKNLFLIETEDFR